MNDQDEPSGPMMQCEEEARHEAAVRRQSVQRAREARDAAERALVVEMSKQLRPDATTYYRGTLCCIGQANPAERSVVSDYGVGETWEDALKDLCKKVATQQLLDEHKRQVADRAALLMKGIR